MFMCCFWSMTLTEQFPTMTNSNPRLRRNGLAPFSLCDKVASHLLRRKILSPLQGLEIFLTINPGRRSRCSLALDYYLSALQAFNLSEFAKFVSKFFVSTPHTSPLPVRNEKL